MKLQLFLTNSLILFAGLLGQQFGMETSTDRSTAAQKS
jgi:hypothetical protein